MFKHLLTICDQMLANREWNIRPVSVYTFMWELEESMCTI